MPSAILIGLGAGCASAVLFSSAATGTVLGVFVLFFLSPLPVAIGGLGWGWPASAVAAIVGAGVVLLTGTPNRAVFHLVALGAPTTLFCYLLLLSRVGVVMPNAGDPAATSAPVPASAMLEWYPVGRLIAWASVWAGAMAAAALYATAPDIDGLKAAIGTTLERVFLSPTAAGGRALTDDERATLVTLMVLVFPWVIATLWFTVAMFNLWAAGLLVRASGRLARPWPDLAAISLPPVMPLAFGLALMLTFLPDYQGLVASGFASALMFAFMLVGLAILHTATRGMALRPMILSFVYMALLFLSPLSSLVVALIGMAEPFLRHRLQRGPPPSSPPTT